MRGLSGAVVVLNGDGTVTKRGGLGERTRAQGLWLSEHECEAFPKIIKLIDDGYVMEELEVLDYRKVSVDMVIELLREHVWSRKAEVTASKNTQKLLVAKIAQTANKWLSAVLDNHTLDLIVQDAVTAADGALLVRPVLSHGDPTAENMMLRHPRQLVLTDPIAATEVVPDSPCVDIGKMLQSAYGWEHAKYGQGPSMFTRHAIEHAVADSELFAFGEAWATVHVMRAIPYILREMPEALDSVISVLERAVYRQ